MIVPEAESAQTYRHCPCPIPRHGSSSMVAILMTGTLVMVSARAGSLFSLWVASPGWSAMPPASGPDCQTALAPVDTDPGPRHNASAKALL